MPAQVHHELELGLVIARTCKNVSEVDALGVLAGYFLSLDVTARDQQLTAKETGMPWTVSKGWDT